MGSEFWQKGALKFTKTLARQVPNGVDFGLKIPPPEGHRVAKLACQIGYFYHPICDKKGEIL